MPSSKPFDERLRLIVESYRRLTGKQLVNVAAADDAALRDALWSAPCAIVAHGTEADPVFFYGNCYALECFEMEFARLPSRLSAEPLAREARAQLLTRVARQGYVEGYSGMRIEGYSGMRIAKSGKRFMICDGTVWNLMDATGICHGQAATFVVEPQGDTG